MNSSKEHKTPRRFGYSKRHFIRLVKNEVEKDHTASLNKPLKNNDSESSCEDDEVQR